MSKIYCLAAEIYASMLSINFVCKVPPPPQYRHKVWKEKGTFDVFPYWFNLLT